MYKFVKILHHIIKAVTAILFGSALIWMVVAIDQREVAEISGIAHISDGDSLVINGQRVRLKGIDAPELKQKCQAAVEWPCGEKAKAALKSFISGAKTVCRAYGRDKYRRILAICKIGEKDIGKWMVTHGLAVSYGDYQFEEALARRNRVGIWQGDFDLPRDWRKDHAEIDAGVRP